MNPLKHYRIFDEEPCPCGSGMKYSLCCKKREDSFQRDNKRPVEVQVAETLKKSQYKCCLHPDKSRCEKHIKEAHALQNNKIISLLSENGHVYMLNDKKPPLIIPTEKGEIETLTLLDKVGVNRATTATCFCDIHDDEVFAAIEKGAPAFDKGNDEHMIVSASGVSRKELWEKPISRDLEQAIQSRQVVTANRGNGTRLVPVTSEEDAQAYTAQVICPIIADGESIGAVVLLSREPAARMGDTELKVAETTASIVGRQMEQ